ncbi:MAG TPA: molybdopterin-dependent oxidoreductase [Anaerolineales bacterium]|jgi:DMSO/TMAO reductase YedYZ molybdopterin-dependent catalytic subunit
MSEGPLGRRQKERRFAEAGRLPPGQSLTEKFPVLHYGRIPQFDPKAWDLRAWGEVEQEKHWTWDDLLALPRTRVTMDIHCVTRWSKFDTEWEGIALRTLFGEGGLKLKPAAQYLVQHCEYGFTVNLPLSVAMADNFLLATHFNGAPITPEHGYPLRGVVGHLPDRPELTTPYLWKGGKWVRGLEFLAQDKPGFWEQAGYHNEADIWKEQRVARGY